MEATTFDGARPGSAISYKWLDRLIALLFHLKVSSLKTFARLVPSFFNAFRRRSFRLAPGHLMDRLGAQAGGLLRDRYMVR